MSTSDPTYRSLLEDASDGIFVLDANRRFIDVNQKACELVGYDRKELLTLRVDDLIDPADLAERPIRFAELLSGRSLLVERVVRRKDGSTFRAEISIRGVTRERFVSIVRDVTQQREAANALRRHHDRDRLILGISTDFLSAPIESLDSAIASALERFGQFMRSDRVWIAVPEADSQTVRVAFSWISGESVPEPRIESGECLGMLEVLKSGKPLVIGSIDRLPAGIDGSFMRRDGILSAVVVPIGGGRSGVGCFVIDTLQESRTWSGDEVDSVRLFAEIVGHTLLRRASFQETIESNERFLLATRATQDMIYDWDIAGSRCWRNDAASRFAGCRPEDVKPEVEWWTGRIHPDDRVTIQKVVDSALEGGRSNWSVKYRLERDDGNWVYVLDRAHVLRSPDGKPSRVIGAVTDVSALREAQAQLEQSEARFRTVIDNVSDLVSVIDAEGNALYRNAAFERMFGYSPTESANRPSFDFIHPADVTRATEELRRLAATPTGSSAEIKFRVRRSDGGWRSIHSVGVNLLENEAVRGIVVISRDMTDLEARASREQHAFRMEALGQLAVRVAHEFSNVLMGIQPSAELLERRLGDVEGVQSAVHHILDSVDRGRRISQEILKFTQPAVPDLETIDLGSWLPERLPELRSLLPESIRLDLEVSGKVEISADADQLGEILERLVRYGRSSIADAGWIAIRAEGEGSGGDESDAVARITVEDTGSGVATERIETLFEPLLSDRIRGGAGLNLAVVRRFVELQRGTIAVESEPGRGTRFHLRFPLAGARRAVEEGADVHDSPPLARRVLVVEDDEAVAWGIGALLESEGTEVEIAYLGADAIPAIERFEPDVVILDVGLPDMDGGDLYRQIAARWPRLPIVFSTGHGSERLLDGVENGHVEFLLKPYESDDLVAAIARVIRAVSGE